MVADKELCIAGSEDTKAIISDRKGSLKVTITPAQHKTLTHLPKRPPVDLAFTDLTYKVQEGRKSSKYFSYKIKEFKNLFVFKDQRFKKKILYYIRQYRPFS